MDVSTMRQPAVWLAGRCPTAPSRATTVRDDQGRRWHLGGDQCWHTDDDRHHTTWRDLSGRTDLVEVPITPAP